MKKHYFVSCMIDNQYEIFETVNLFALLRLLVSWATDGEQVSNVTIKTTKL